MDQPVHDHGHDQHHENPQWGPDDVVDCTGESLVAGRIEDAATGPARRGPAGVDEVGRRRHLREHDQHGGTAYPESRTARTSMKMHSPGQSSAAWTTECSRCRGTDAKLAELPGSL